MKRSSAVVIAVTIQRLLEVAARYWPKEEELVLESLRRSKTSLNGASNSDLRGYIEGLNPEQFQGTLNNVKGIYHELLFVNAELTDGDEVSARVFDATNHPGADVEFLIDGEVIREVQLKATSSVNSILEHLEKYPDIEILSTAEVASKVDGIESSGFSNAEITENARKAMEDLDGEGLIGEISDGVATSGIMSAAILAGNLLKKEKVSKEEFLAVGNDVAVGGIAAIVLEIIL